MCNYQLDYRCGEGGWHKFVPGVGHNREGCPHRVWDIYNSPLEIKHFHVSLLIRPWVFHNWVITAFDLRTWPIPHLF